MKKSLLSILILAIVIMCFVPIGKTQASGFGKTQASSLGKASCLPDNIGKTQAFEPINIDMNIPDNFDTTHASLRNFVTERTQVDFDGNEVTVPLEYREMAPGTGLYMYYLADAVRNITFYRYAGPYTATKQYGSPDGVIDDPIAVTVYMTLIDIYDYYADPANTGYAYKGLNGKNDDVADNADISGEIMLNVYMHYGDEWENASCGYEADLGSAIMYVGDGKKGGVLETPGKAKDILAHEYQHAITDLCAGGGEGLEYLNEAAALSEGISDIFGALIEGLDPSDEGFWTIGESVVPYGKDAPRSMKDYQIAKEFGQVFHMADEKPLCYKNHDHFDNEDDCDNGHAHANCTIPTHAQYRMWQRNPEFFTRENIGKLWFETVRSLDKNSDFAAFAEKMIDASKKLFPSETKAQQDIYDCLYERGFIDDENSHIVTFVDGKDSEGNDIVIEKVTVPNGGTAVAPDEPIYKAGGEGGTLKFSGWDRELTDITADTIIHATYELGPTVTHTVTFKDGERELASVTVEYGKDAEFDGTPTRESDEMFDYTFSHFEGKLENVTEDRTIYAIFDATPRSYEVKFYDGETVIETLSAHYGETLTLPSPERKDGYEFEGWFLDRQLTERATELEVKGDAELFGKWRALEEFTVTFMNGDEVFYKATVRKGETATCTNVPTRESDEQYDYTFSHFEGKLDNVTEDRTIYAIFDATPRSYEVKFYDGETVIETLSAHYGETLALPSPEQRDGYEFAGWFLDKEFVRQVLEFEVKGDAELFGKWRALEEFTVTFMNGDEVFYKATVRKDETATCTNVPTRESDEQYDYTFSHFEGKLDNVTEDRTV